VPLWRPEIAAVAACSELSAPIEADSGVETAPAKVEPFSSNSSWVRYSKW
jgi:hypothetical protein